eukprot:Awhi_evm1s745
MNTFTLSNTKVHQQVSSTQVPTPTISITLYNEKEHLYTTTKGNTTMFHNLKKAFKRSGHKTVDEEYDRLHKEFTPLLGKSQQMNQLLKSTFQCWEQLQTNVDKVLHCTYPQADVKEPEGLTPSKKNVSDDVANGKHELVQWKKDLQERKMKTNVPDAPAELPDIYDLLDAFTAACQKVNTMHGKRTDTVNELDYYRGKYDTLKNKDSKKSEDLLAVDRTHETVQTLQDYYEELNEAIKDNMQRLIDYQPEVFETALSSVMDLHNNQSFLLGRVCDQLNIPPDRVVAAKNLTLQVKEAVVPFDKDAPKKPRKSSVSNSSARDDYAGDDHDAGNFKKEVVAQYDFVAESDDHDAGNFKKEVVAQYDFVAESEKELNLKAGEHITVLEQLDSNWYLGRSGNQE